MSLNPQVPAFVPAKSCSTPTPSPAPQTSSAVSGNEVQRRSGGSGASSAGTSSAARSNLASPRNNQSGRKNHRNHRKPNTPRFDTDEQVAMTSSSSRKGTSITHLINWDAAAPRPHSFNEFRPRNTRRNPTWGLGSGYHAVDKARYVNANYRFIVHPRGDYRAQAVDSDAHLPWDRILQVLASARSQCSNCPICLSEPVAPRMTKCGHIFCLPCLIRYMASTDDSNKGPEKKARYKKCVICTDSVYMNDIRPVRFFTGQENEAPREGGDVILRLIRRKQGSTVALPRDGADPPERLEEIPWHFAAEVMDYARVMKGTEEYMMEQYAREIEELNLMEKEDELMFGEEGDWAKKAVSMIRGLMEGAKSMGNAPRPLMEPSKAKEKEKRPAIEFKDSDDLPVMYDVHHEASSGHSPASSQSHTPAAQPEPQQEPVPVANGAPSQDTRISNLSLSLARARLQTTGPDSSNDGAYYFYQALLHYYLSPLDIRILKAAFGDYSALPSTILPRVENVTTGHTVDDDLRKRAKYLAHLPYGCEVGFLECDWTDIVPPEILEKFDTEIERRRKRKKDKESKEERDRIKADRREEEERWASTKFRRRGSVREEFSQEDFVALTTQDSLPETGSDAMGLHPTGNLAGSWGNSSRTGFGSLASPGTSPAQGRTVWGTPVVHLQHEPELRPHPPTNAEEDNGGWLPDWERDMLLEAEVLAQIEAEEALPGSSSGGRAPSHGRGQKKKKVKKVTLMTNGGRRGL